MKNNYIRSVILLAPILFLVTVHSQGQTLQRQGISSYGSSNLIDGVRIQQTVGQPYATGGNAVNDITLRQGFQQFSNFRMEVTKLPEKLIFNVYPNPVVHSAVLETKDFIENAFIQVTDMNGKTMLQEYVTELRKYEIRCDGWPLGIYFIKITDKNKSVYSSRIIKTK
jgi:hypothetical protein